MLTPMFSWLSKFVQHPARIGAVAPSSASLARLMTDELKPNSRVLELGPGSGAITPFILERLSSPSQLTLIEIDHDFAERCKKTFAGTNVIEGDIVNILTQQNATYDAIISGIPFAAMGKERAEEIFKLIRDHLTPGGQFIMFQYSTRTLGEVKNVFGNTHVRFTPWNLPPAFVFFATREDKK